MECSTVDFELNPASAAVQELKLSYWNTETLLLTTYPYDGDLISVP